VVGAGMRSSRGIVMQVTDETGRPVEGAAVSFHLPSDGPSGLFLSGLKTEITTTGPDGRASVYGIQWNNVPGPVQIRVTAVKGEARAGIIVTHYLSEKAVAEEPSSRERGQQKSGGSKKWLYLVLVAAGVGAGAAFGLSQSNQGAAPGSTVVPPAASSAAPAIGAPTISVGKP